MYPSHGFVNLSFTDILDHPLSWAAAGFVVGLALGVNSTSVWLVAVGLAAFVVYLWQHGAPEERTEGRLFAAGPLMIVGWLVGFVVHGLAF